MSQKRGDRSAIWLCATALIGWLAISSGCGAAEPIGASDSGRSITIGVSQVDPTGIGVGIHPTSDRVEASSSSAAVQACPGLASGQIAPLATGHSWGLAWPGECLDLNADPVELPLTTGEQHVGIRFIPTRDADDLSGIRIRWVPADGHLEYQPGTVLPQNHATLIVDLDDPMELVGSLRVSGSWEIHIRRDGSSFETIRGEGSLIQATFASLPDAGEWVIDYTNTGQSPQTPSLSFNWDS